MRGVAARLVIVSSTAALAAVAACFIKPDPPRIGDGGTIGDIGSGGDGGTGDARIDGASSCADPEDDFSMSISGGGQCGAWGSGSGVGGFTILRNPSQQLFMSTAVIAGSFAKCSSSQPVDVSSRGTSLELVSPASGSGARTWLLTRFSDLTVELSIFQMGGGFYASLECDLSPPGMTTLGSPPFWMKLSSIPSGGGREFQVHRSANAGSSWEVNAILACMANPVSPSFATVELGVTTGSGTSMATFDNLNTHTCNPHQ